MPNDIRKNHETIQAFLDSLYKPLETEINQSKFALGNEIYGELFYYSFVKLLNNISITNKDHFLDIGSGLGKIIFQVYFNSPAKQITGIEINNNRYKIAIKIYKNIIIQLPLLFNNINTNPICFYNNDFLTTDLAENISIVYTCSTVFSPELLSAIGKKINQMPNVHTVISVRKIPNLTNLFLTKKIFLHGDWDIAAYHIYTRNLI